MKRKTTIAVLAVAISVAVGIAIAVIAAAAVLSGNRADISVGSNGISPAATGPSSSGTGGVTSTTTADSTLQALPSAGDGNNDKDAPKIADRGLKAELVADGLSRPTSMAFVDGGVLVLEKETGRVVFISGADKQQEVLKVNVATGAEHGLLGIASAAAAKSAGGGKDYVFLYFTEADTAGHALGNRVYRYDWDAGRHSLSSPKLILDLPAVPGPTHNGGKLAVSGDRLFAVVGDVNRKGGGPLTNEQTGEIDDTSVLVRVDFDGRPPDDNPFVSYGKHPLAYYYAYGIRNSFGMDFDPLTGTLWMTENGPDSYDEINVVRPGFNSGWHKLTGPMGRWPGMTEDSLMQLQGSHYQDPVFSWKQPVGVTDIEFLKSDKLGERYKNNIFVADYNAGALYYFTVNEKRDGLQLGYLPELADLVADDNGEAQKVRIGLFPGGITDLATGPDGYLYVLDFGNGRLYRIVPYS